MRDYRNNLPTTDLIATRLYREATELESYADFCREEWRAAARREEDCADSLHRLWRSACERAEQARRAFHTWESENYHFDVATLSSVPNRDGGSDLALRYGGD